MRKRTLILLLLFSCCLCSCEFFRNLIHDDVLVARIGDRRLYVSDIEKVIPDGVSPADSAAMAEQFITSWASDILFARVAKSQLTKAELDVDADLADYKRTLLKYRYEQKFVNTRMDTVVTREQKEEYYQRHKTDFILSRPVVKFRFVDLMKDSPYRTNIIRMLPTTEGHGLDSLALSSALKVFDSSEKWTDISVLAREFGMEWPALLSLMKDNMIRFEPSGRGDMLVAYVFGIVREGPAPIEYCDETIKDKILSRRKRDLLSGLERDLLNNALETGDFVKK